MVSLLSHVNLLFIRIRLKRWHILVLLLLCTPLLAASNDYRFTYTNPSVGDPRAPFVLEYFSLVDCLPCRRFESEQLEQLLELVDEGRLRIVFRDLLPDEAVLAQGRWLFCLQEYPDYLNKRRAAKRTGQFESTPQPILTGKRQARYQSCLDGGAAFPVLSHNKSAFDEHQFFGTPSFLLSSIQGQSKVVQTWSGAISIDDLSLAMSSSILRRQ